MPLSVPSPRTFGVSEVENAAYLNSVRDGLNFLLAKPLAVLSQTATQSLPNSTATAVGMDTTIVDTYGGHSNTTNNSRYTAVVAGWYWVRGQCAFAPNGTGDRGVQIYKNGIALNISWNIAPSANAAFAPGRETSGPVFLNVGDYVELWAIQSAGGPLNTFSGSTAMASLNVWWLHN